ncbi:MAG: dienelactone hydrolase family protein [Candidatus Korobacteraceae bacterium]
MSEHVTLQASDGHTLDAYVAHPEGEPIAGLVVVQEIFGVNRHIRSVADGYAKDGFLAVAPALFDRYERGLELGYEGADMQKAMSLVPRINLDHALLDTAAALEYVRKQTGKKCGVIGYCYGGTIAWLAAARLGADAAVGYYGGHIAKFADEHPDAPIQLHFGKLDAHIPKESIDAVQAANPEVPIFWYDAGHGFNCNDRASYNAEAATLARARSLEFLQKQLG